MMIANLAGLACAGATVGRRAGSTLGHRVASKPRASVGRPRREVVWKLRLGPLYLTTRSASLELGLLGTRQRAGLRCGAMLSWIVLAFSRMHARAGIREEEFPSSQSLLFYSYSTSPKDIYLGRATTDWPLGIHTVPLYLY